MITFSYDPAGNRTTDQKASDYVFNPLNQLTAGAGAVYTYDANGNRLSELRTLTSELTRYAWDAENRLTRIDFPDGGYVEYKYDPFGRRIQKRIVAAGGTETIRRYVYDREDILFELDGNGAVVTEYLHGPGIDEPLSMRRDGKRYYYHQDALGSIVAITDQTGTLVQRYEYDAYGNITYVLDPAFKQPYAFTGREYDEESGLYYYRARYYDPRTGRFISKDPIGVKAGDQNLYRYVRNNPISLSDPSGLVVYNNSPYTIYVKPENNAPVGILPPRHMWPGSPDGIKVGDGPWIKTPGKSYLPDNVVEVKPDGTVVCKWGPCSIPTPWTLPDPRPDLKDRPDWNIPPDPKPMPDSGPIPEDPEPESGDNDMC